MNVLNNFQLLNIVVDELMSLLNHSELLTYLYVARWQNIEPVHIDQLRENVRISHKSICTMESYDLIAINDGYITLGHSPQIEGLQIRREVDREIKSDARKMLKELKI